MPQLFYCNTTHLSSPPTDINPLIRQRYPCGKILVFCSCKTMLKRVTKALVQEKDNPFPNQIVHVLGWWQLEDEGFIVDGIVNPSMMWIYDIIIVIGKDEIHNKYLPILKAVEEYVVQHNC